MKISGRLLALAKYMTMPKAIVCDIGTDHALLAIYLINNNLAEMVYATDILPEPLMQGQQNVNKYAQNSAKITLLISNGFEKLPHNEVYDYAIIAGLGSNNIVKILETLPPEIKVKNFLVCPTDNAKAIRKWIQIKNYFVSQEEIIEDSNLFYEIILINQHVGQKLITKTDLIFGPILSHHQSSLFKKKWTQQKQHYQKLLAIVPITHKNYQKINDKIKLINEVLKNGS